MTAIMLLVAYLLPLPIIGACFYYHVFEQMDLMQRLIAIGITSIVPSGILMIFVMKRIVHFIFHLILLGGVLFALYHFGLIGHAAR